MHTEAPPAHTHNTPFVGTQLRKCTQERAAAMQARADMGRVTPPSPPPPAPLPATEDPSEAAVTPGEQPASEPATEEDAAAAVQQAEEEKGQATQAAGTGGGDVAADAAGTAAAVELEELRARAKELDDLIVSYTTMEEAARQQLEAARAEAKEGRTLWVCSDVMFVRLTCMHTVPCLVGRVVSQLLSRPASLSLSWLAWSTSGSRCFQPASRTGATLASSFPLVRCLPRAPSMVATLSLSDDLLPSPCYPHRTRASLP